jgi:hypothetical protein
MKPGNSAALRQACRHVTLKFACLVFVGLFLQTAVRAQTSDVVLYASEATTRSGNWVVEGDATAAGGARIRYPDAGGPRLTTAFANPTHYFETTFTAQAGIGYRLWMRGKADANSTNNDSAWVQFSNSVDDKGTPVFRIGTTSATMFNLEECTGCGLSAWGWNDNLFGGLGPLIFFANSGTQTIRVQLREDGLAIDQIVLSPQTYLNNSPGLVKNDNTILPKSNGGPQITLVRQPYIQQVTSNSAIVVWATRELGKAQVRFWRGLEHEQAITLFGTTRLFPSSATGMPFDYYQNEVQLPNLSANATYNYDPLTDAIDVTPGRVDTFTTGSPTGSGSVRFVAFGDSGTLSTQQLQLRDLLANETFDLAIHSGDIAYENGTYQQFHDTFFAIYGGWMRSRPVYPCIGNHDDRTAAALPYRELFVLPENGASSAFPDHKERYYSFDYGPVHFIALDSELAFLNTTRRQEQLNWLAADLASTTQPWRVVFFHRPPYSSGFHGSDLALRQTFGPLFEQHGVQLVINGHEHNYERLVPWRESGSRAVTYVVTGGGGAQLRAVGQSEWTALSRSAHHFLRGTISGCQLTLQAVGLNGMAFDSYVLDRCAQANDAAPPAVSITQPAAGENVSGTSLVRVQASDDVRVEKVDLWIDGALHTIDTAAPYDFSWNTTSLADGSHTIEARAYDIAGKRVSSGPRTVNVRNATGLKDIVLYASEATTRAGNWVVEGDATAAGGARIRYPDAGGPRLTTAFANPTHYFETTFTVQAGIGYRLWMRGKADANSTNNDSAWVQFSNSVDNSGTPVFRIGTTAATMFNLEECTGCGLSAWGWNDNLFGGLGPLIFFANSGTQTIRVQLREDGLAIDQIVLSPQTYLNNSPGVGKNDTTILPKSNSGTGQ